MDKSLTLRSNSFVSGFLRVGALAAVGYNVLEIAQVNQTLNVDGDLSLEGDLALAGSLIIDDVAISQNPYIVTCGDSSTWPETLSSKRA